MCHRGLDALLAAAVLSQRELFARLLLDPREARAARRRLCMPRRRIFDYSGAKDARAAARTGRRVPPRAALTSAAVGERRRRDKTPAWGWRSWRWFRRRAGALEGGDFGADPEPWWAAAAAVCAAAAMDIDGGSQRLDCVHWRGYGAAAAWSGGTARRRPELGLAGERLRRGAEAQGARRLAKPSRQHRALPSAGNAWAA